MRKKKRTAAQIAATKKLVAFNKKKRGKKKTTKKRATRKNPLSQAAKAAIRRQPKSRLNVVFAIKNGAVKYYDGLKGWVTSKGLAGRYDVAHARVVARHTGRFAGPGYSVGVTSESTTVAELRKLMQPGK